MGFRRFLVRYAIGGDVVEKYADNVAELERLLLIPRSLGVCWSFKSVA